MSRRKTMDEEFIECKLRFYKGKEITLRISTVEHNVGNRTGTVSFDLEAERNLTDLVSASLRLNGKSNIASFYFEGIEFIARTYFDTDFTVYSHIRNENGIGCHILCNKSNRISNFSVDFDYITLLIIANIDAHNNTPTIPRIRRRRSKKQMQE